MQYYKYIDEHNVKRYKDGFIIKNGNIITNPSDEEIRSIGYKPMKETKLPEVAGDEHVIAKYSETETEILKTYEINKDE